MRCNGLPNAYDPSDLRKYMHMWWLQITNKNHLEQNWLLYANERSILTQDQTIDNLTRKNLGSQQANLGDIYSERVIEVLGVCYGCALCIVHLLQWATMAIFNSYIESILFIFIF